MRISKQFFASISYKWRTTIRISFNETIPDGFESETIIEVIVRWKAVPGWLKEGTKFVRGHFEKEVTLKNWTETVIETAHALKDHSEDVVSFCRMSSNTDSMGNVIMKY